ncbi:hypothetical protein [Duganella sp. BJB476]|uniref:hypothetical protein n=1 Tax=Duganella sp. BJB476 TaxID=1871176 RepID=UPI001E2F505F|nr:hypothetical protein [Duganella sp. BJB476]
MFIHTPGDKVGHVLLGWQGKHLGMGMILSNRVGHFLVPFVVSEWLFFYEYDANHEAKKTRGN